MAHFIKLHQLDVTHENEKTYNPILFNLDTVVTIEPSVSGKHSVITTRWSSAHGIKVRETLDEILELSRECKDKPVLLG